MVGSVLFSCTLAYYCTVVRIFIIFVVVCFDSHPMVDDWCMGENSKLAVPAWSYSICRTVMTEKLSQNWHFLY